MQKRLSPIQFALLALMAPLIATTTVYSYLIAGVGARGWWVTILLGGMITTGLGLISLSYPISIPGRTLVGHVQYLRGRFVGALLAIPVIVTSATGVFLTLSLSNELIKATVLPHMSTSLIWFGALIPVVFHSYHGPVTIGRHAELNLLLIYGPGLLFIAIWAMPNIRPALLGPYIWWPHGVPFSADFWPSVLLPWGIPSLMMLTPFVDVEGVAKFRLLLWIGAISTVILIFSAGYVLGTLGPGLSRQTVEGIMTTLNLSTTTILFLQQYADLAVILILPTFWIFASSQLWSAAQAVEDVMGASFRTPALFLIAVAIWWAGSTSDLGMHTILLPLSDWLWANLGLYLVFQAGYFMLMRQKQKDKAYG